MEEAAADAGSPERPVDAFWPIECLYPTRSWYGYTATSQRNSPSSPSAVAAVTHMSLLTSARNVHAAVVGVGVLRGGAVVRSGTGTVVDESGLVITTNHNVDRLLHEDVVLIAVPSFGVEEEGSVTGGRPRMRLHVPPLGTCPVDVNERVSPGELRAFEKQRWVWTHAGVVLVETLHHEQDDRLGNQGMDVAVIRVTHTVEYIRTPGDDKLPDAAPAVILGTHQQVVNGVEHDALSCDGRAGDVSTEEVATPIATAVDELFPPVMPWQLTRSINAPYARKRPQKQQMTKMVASETAKFAGTQLRKTPLLSDARFTALQLGNSDYTAAGHDVVAVGYGTDWDAFAGEEAMKVAPVERERWLFGEPEVITTRNITLSGAPVFTLPGWSFVGIMVSSNVPYKLASDKAFFESWLPEESEDHLAGARLVAGYQPIRPINLAYTLIRAALHRVPQLHRVQPRASWRAPAHSGTQWLHDILQPHGVSDEKLATHAAACHRSTRWWFFREFEEWCGAEFRPTLSRVMRVRGPSGVGKTALCAQLCCQGGGRVLTWHFCDDTSMETCQPNNVLRTLAYNLACNLPSYASALFQQLHGTGSEVTPQVVRERLELLDALQLFEELFVAPLSTCPPPSSKCVVAVMDGVDVATTFSVNPFLQIARTEWSRLPKWMGLVLSCRPSGSVDDISETIYKTIRLEPGDANNREDVRRCCDAVVRGWFSKGGVGGGPALDDDIVEWAVDTLSHKASGLFLYCSKAFAQLGRVRDMPKLLEAIDLLPDNLDGLLNVYMSRAIQILNNRARTSFSFADVFRPLLQVFVAAQQELTCECVQCVLAADPEFTASPGILSHALDVLSPDEGLLRCVELGGVRVYHIASVAVAHWLVDKARNVMFNVNARRGHKACLSASLTCVRQACEEYERSAAPPATHQPLLTYALHHVFAHARALQTFAPVVELLTRPAFIQLRRVHSLRLCASSSADYHSALEHIQAYVSKSANAASVSGSIKPTVPVIGSTTVRVGKAHLSAGPDHDVATLAGQVELLRAYAQLFDGHKGVIVQSSHGLSDVIRELDPTHPVREHVTAATTPPPQTPQPVPPGTPPLSTTATVMMGSTSLRSTGMLSASGLSMVTRLRTSTRQLREQASAVPVVVPRHATRVFGAHIGWVLGVCVSDDGRRMASCGVDNTVRVWNAGTGASVSVLEPGCTAPHMVLSGDGESRRQFAQWAVAISADGSILASAGEDCVVHVWNVESGRYLWGLAGMDGHTAWVCALAMDNPGKTIVSGGRDSVLRQWDVRTGELLHAFKGHTSTIWSTCMIDDGHMLASAGADGTCRIWDGASGGAVCVIPVCTGGDVSGVSASNARPGVVVCSRWDGVVVAWDWTTHECLWQHKLHGQDADNTTDLPPPVRAVWMSEDGRYVFSGCERGSVVRVDASTGEEAIVLRGHAGAITSIMSSFDSLQTFTASKDGTVRMWCFT